MQSNTRSQIYIFLLTQYFKEEVEMKNKKEEEEEERENNNNFNFSSGRRPSSGLLCSTVGLITGALWAAHNGSVIDKQT